MLSVDSTTFLRTDNAKQHPVGGTRWAVYTVLLDSGSQVGDAVEMLGQVGLSNGRAAPNIFFDGSRGSSLDLSFPIWS